MCELEFDFAQQSAINHGEGPALVVAGPGSGKTAVITERLFRMTSSGIDPFSILAVTFSNAAVNEMKERYIRRGGKYGVTFCTFHSYLYGLIRRAGQASGENPGGSVSGKSKSWGADSDGFGEISFDEMLTRGLWLLKNDDKILAGQRKRFKHVLIDEFQDINRTQYEAVKLIAKPEDNIFAVGDDDQSVYGFRGADPAIMFEFAKEYKNMRIINLSTNYRSCAGIVTGAAALISNNKNRFEKEISLPDSQPGGTQILRTGRRKTGFLSGDEKKEGIFVRSSVDIFTQAEAIAGEIKSIKREGIPSFKTAVLLRNADLIEIFAYALEKNGIPFFAAGTAGSLFAGRTARRIVSQMRAAARINSAGISVNDAGLGVAAGLPTAAAMEFFRLKDSGRLPGMEAGKSEQESEKNAYDFLYETAKCFPDKEEWLKFADHAAKKVRPEKETGAGSSVSVMTMHAAKGLEFDVVFLPAVNNEIIPGRRTECEEQLEEERRIFYVALTRARKRAYIFVAERIGAKKSEASVFLKEVLREKG